MRLFVGVEIAPAVAAAAAALVDELRRRAERLDPSARITWIPRERMHLTVRFIGNVDDALAAGVQTALLPPIAGPCFDLSLGGVGAFPPSGRPQVLWAGISAGLDRLQSIERDVTRRLAGVGVPADERGYNPHLTLARVRERTRLRSQALFAGLEPTALGTTRVQAITLYESRLSPKGPTYVPVQRTMLQEV
jgi:2'-5' RNA ligase